MNEMVERAAKAIWSLQKRSGDWPVPEERLPWDTVSDEYKNAFRGVARAVIEAMREPTEGMKERGDSEVYDIAPGVGSGDVTSSLWHTMIDAALADEKQDA